MPLLYYVVKNFPALFRSFPPFLFSDLLTRIHQVVNSPLEKSMWKGSLLLMPCDLTWKWSLSQECNDCAEPTSWLQSFEKPWARPSCYVFPRCFVLWNVWENKFSLFSVINFGLICYSTRDNQYRKPNQIQVVHNDMPFFIYPLNSTSGIVDVWFSFNSIRFCLIYRIDT